MGCCGAINAPVHTLACGTRGNALSADSQMHTHMHTLSEESYSVDVPNVICFDLVHRPVLMFKSYHPVNNL